MAQPSASASTVDPTRPTSTPTLRFSYRTTAGGIVTHKGPNLNCKSGSSATGKHAFFEKDESNPEVFSRSGNLCNVLYSPDGKLLAQVIREKPVLPAGVAGGGAMNESRFIELFDVNPANGGEPKLVHRIPPANATETGGGLAGVEDWIYFSPLSRFLVTWQPVDKVKKGEDGAVVEGNLKVWDTRTGALMISWLQPQRQAWPVCRWTPNERLLLRLNQGQLHVIDWQMFVAGKAPETTTPPSLETSGVSAIPIRRETIVFQGITEFAVTHGACSVFIPERKGMPAKVSVFRINDGTESAKLKKKKAGGPNQKNGDDDDDQTPLEQLTENDTTPVATLIASQEPSATKSFYKADEVQMYWHNRGEGVLVHASTITDSSGKSYYGETSLYYLQADGKFDANVVLDKKGPIHAVAWNPRGNDFAVCYGFMPARTTLFSRKCRALGHLGTGSRNTLIWSPHGRVLCVGGFGGLPGEIDFWDTAKLTKLGSCTAYCASSHIWSPDGRYLMCSVVWPRLKVDNGIKIFNVAGQLLFSTPAKSLTELWQVQWQGIPLEYQPGLPPQFTYPRAQNSMTVQDVYPDVDFTKVADPEAVNAPPKVSGPTGGPAKAAAPAPGKYRHPHWSGQMKSAMTNEEEGPQKVLASGVSRPVVGGHKVESAPQQRLPPGATPVGGVPVGGVPAGGNAKQAAKNRARRQRKKANKADGGAPNGEDDGDDGDE